MLAGTHRNIDNYYRTQLTETGDAAISNDTSWVKEIESLRASPFNFSSPEPQAHLVSL